MSHLSLLLPLALLLALPLLLPQRLATGFGVAKVFDFSKEL